MKLDRVSTLSSLVWLIAALILGATRVASADGVIVIMLDGDRRSDFEAALRVELAGRLGVVAEDGPVGATAEERAASARQMAVARGAQAATWVDPDATLRAITADGQIVRYAPLPALPGQISPRVFAVVAMSLLDELTAPPQPPVRVSVNVDVDIGDGGPDPEAPTPVVPFVRRESELVRAVEPPLVEPPVVQRSGWYLAGGPLFAGVAAGAQLGVGRYLDPNLKLALTGLGVVILPTRGSAAALGLRLTHVGRGSQWHLDYGLEGSLVMLPAHEMTGPPLAFAGWTSGAHVGVGWDLSRVRLAVQLTAGVARVQNELSPQGWGSFEVELPL